MTDSSIQRSVAQQRAHEEHRVEILTGILEDLPRGSESTEVLLDEIQQARIRAEYFGRLLRRDDS